MNPIHKQLHTVRDFWRYFTTLFQQSGIHFGHGTTTASEEARYLITEVLSIPYDELDNALDARLLEQEGIHLIALANRRMIERIPVAYLVNRAYFAGLPFYVDSRVLIPRSPLAESIEHRFLPWIKGEHTVEHILDIGTGSGCLAIACAYAFPEATIDAVDIDPEALKVAQKNSLAHGCDTQIHLYQGDCFQPLSPDRQYDIILSNPPYVSAEELAHVPPEFHHEPKIALEASNHGLACVEKILHQAAPYLKKEGILVVELGNTAHLLESQYPDLPFTWLEFKRGGTGVFLLTASDLSKTSEGKSYV